MKRPQKVTRETRPSQYARKMYGKDKIEKIMDEEDVTSLRRGSKKKVRTLLNRRLRQAMKKEDLPSGGAYRKVLDMEEE
ncbi:hypothetical protein [Dialister sp.]|uniref:hypothetical protein n=1 Tax=Dialister sp. TaxID=1955814 RepID=UPI002E8051C0|nr:hypothetical protein [Dialister sp.]MEE3453489.1 hypothetical protein [Dialister sp.]